MDTQKWRRKSDISKTSENPALKDVPVLLFSTIDEIEKISKKIEANDMYKNLLIWSFSKRSLRNGFKKYYLKLLAL